MTAQADTPVGTPDLVEYLEWDSAFFGLRVARIRPHGVTPDDLANVAAWARSERIDCLYLFADPDDRSSIVAAEEQAAHFVDWRVTFQRTLAEAQPHVVRSDGVRFRSAVPKDVAVLRDIARTAHTQTRFFFDGRFPRERCETLYELWIEQSVHGHADHVVVPEIHGAAAGYVTCHRDGNTGRIGLVGLHESARGRGIGVAMIRAALEWFASQHIGEVSVVTQGRNVAASRLYERCGFEMRSALAIYHWWPRQVRG